MDLHLYLHLLPLVGLISAPLQLQAAPDETNCGVDILYQMDGGVIASHRLYGRQPYLSNSLCRYFIRAGTPDYHIEINTVKFDLEYSAKCTADSVTVFDGGNETSSVLGKFCGSSDWSVLSKSSMITLVFLSDAHLEKGGFQLRYRFVPNSEFLSRAQNFCPQNYTNCADGTGCYLASWKCDGIKDCSDGSDEDQCPSQRLNCAAGFTKSCNDNSKCVSNQWWCDGFRDCGDGSDENNCGDGSTDGSTGGSTDGSTGGSTGGTVIVTSKSPSGCGTPSIAPDETRIVGSKEVVRNSWPWMVSLRLYGGHFCGGSILNANWIVTAAHCVHNYVTPSIWGVDAGRHCRDCSETTLQSRNVIQIVRHPNYDPSRTNQDIAMMKVDRPFVFNAQVSPICLPSSPVSNTANCFATGWGATKGTGDNTRLLQVMVPIVPNSICGDSSHYGGGITNFMVCAGYEQGGKDACQGDSGGPLMCKSGGVWFLQGVTSWGEGCAKPQRPGVYTRVQLFTNWIQQTGST